MVLGPGNMPLGKLLGGADIHHQSTLRKVGVEILRTHVLVAPLGPAGGKDKKGQLRKGAPGQERAHAFTPTAFLMASRKAATGWAPRMRALP